MQHIHGRNETKYRRMFPAPASLWHHLASGGDASALDVSVRQDSSSHRGSPGYERHHAARLGHPPVTQYLVWSRYHLHLDHHLPRAELVVGEEKTELMKDFLNVLL